MLFADFESKLDSVNRESGNLTDALASNKTFTNKKQMHQIVSFSLVFVDTDEKLLYEKAYCGENAGEYTVVATNSQGKEIETSRVSLVAVHGRMCNIAVDTQSISSYR